MTVMKKKKNISLSRFRGNQDNANKKISKLEPPVSKRSRKDNQSFKETSARYSSKKTLVPLKVDFVPNSSNGVLKKNSSGTGEKRRVSFNKELYIRYRTTSEESSNSTLKDKRNKLKRNYNQCWMKEFVNAQKCDKLVNRNCSWSYRSPKTIHKSIGMEVTKEFLHAPETPLEDVPQNNLEPTINNNLFKENKNDYFCTTNENYIEKNTLYALQKEIQNEDVNLNKEETYNEPNDEVSNEEFLDEEVKDAKKEIPKKTHIVSLSNSKIVSDEKNVQETFNESVASDSSSNDEVILQTRFPVQDEECSSPKSPASFANVSDNESKNDSEIERPLETQTVYEEEKFVDYTTNASSFEINQQSEENNQEIARDRANYNFLSIDVDNSDIENEIHCKQNSTTNNNKNINFDESKGESKILSQEITKTAKNKNILDQNAEERNDISPDAIITDFFNGSFDISIFKPEKNSTMIEGDKMVAKSKHLMKDEHTASKRRKYTESSHRNTNYNKEVYSVLDYSSEAKHKYLNNNMPAADSITLLKRKISDKQTENPKKARMVTRHNKDKDIILDKLTLKTKSKSENEYSKASSQNRRVSNKSLNDDKGMTILNNSDLREENIKKNKTKSMKRTKSNKNEEIFKVFSNNITPLMKTRNSRNSSLVAAKKIKEIEKLENSYKSEEVLLDSDSSCVDYKMKEIKNDFKDLFKIRKSPSRYKAGDNLLKDKFDNEDIDIASVDGLQTCFEKQGKKASKKTASRNRKVENKIENTLDACKVKMDNITSEKIFISDPYQLDFDTEENRDTDEKYKKTKNKISSRQQNKSNKITGSKQFEYGKNIDKATTSKKNTKSTTHYGITTRSKKKTWDTLEKELLGESDDVPFTNSVTANKALNKQLTGKHSMKDVDLYSTSNTLMIPSTSMSMKRNEYDEKYEMQNTGSKYLQISANTTQSNEIIPYKSKSIVEKTIAKMDRCIADFSVPKKNFSQWMQGGFEFDDMIDSIDQETEFHSNMTFVTKENEKYYKNEIVAIVKQSSSIKVETPRRSSTGDISTSPIHSDGEYNYSFSDGEHLVKKSIVTKSYLVRGNSEESLTMKKDLIPSTNEKQDDPWSRLMSELNLEKCNNERKYKAISNGKPNRKSIIYHDNLKQYTNAHPNIKGKILPTLDLNKTKVNKQDEIEKQENEQLTLEKTSAGSNNMATSNDLNVEDNCVTNGTEPTSNKNTEISNISVTRKMATKGRQAHQKKKVKTSPKFKLQVEDGGVKFKRCNKSFSSSSEESEKQRQRSRKQEDEKLTKDQQKLKRQKYKRYLQKRFGKEEALPEEKRENNKIESISKEENSKKVAVQDENGEQGKMIKTLIAKDDDDLFSISSSDSEPVSKGKGLLFDIFDE